MRFFIHSDHKICKSGQYFMVFAIKNEQKKNYFNFAFFCRKTVEVSRGF